MRETLLEMQINVRLQGMNANYPDARRMNIIRGETPAGRMVDESQAAGKPLRLSVNVTNRACNLYRRLGFQRYGGDEVQHYLERLPD